jgi:hypothetical protein
MALRGTLSKDWVKLLEIVVESLNNTPTKRIGYLTPNSINSEIDSVKVIEAKKAHGLTIIKEPSYTDQTKNQENYMKSENNLSVGTYVYRDFNQKLFDKSFDVSVSYY